MNRTVRKGAIDEARNIYVVYPSTWELYCVLILPCVEYIFFMSVIRSVSPFDESMSYYDAVGLGHRHPTIRGHQGLLFFFIFSSTNIKHMQNVC